MKAILNSFIAISAAMITLSSCDKALDIDSRTLEGIWSLSNADERVVEDGTVHYTFLEEGRCLVAAYNALDDSEDATRYSVCTWSLAGNVLTIDSDGGFNYNLSRKSKDRILCTSDSHDVEYYLVREKGTDYGAVIGSWFAEKTGTMTDTDCVGSEHIRFWDLEFELGQTCLLTTGIEDMLAMNRVSYNCFWFPDGASFTLVGHDMKPAYQGVLKDRKISMHHVFPQGETITLTKPLLE